MGLPAADTAIEKLQARIDHLEENRRFIQNALEMVLSMADFQFDISGAAGLERLLEEAVERIKKIIVLQGCAVFLVDEQSAEFVNAFCCPHELCPNVRPQVEFMIEEGFFAWAIRERRGLHISSQDHNHQFLLHVIANNSRVQGMFIGLMPEGKTSVPDTSLTLLSITLFNLANVLESLNLYQVVKNQNTLLEEKVVERTRRLNESKHKLKKAMLRQERLAKEAEQASKAKGQFLANMSHEIRTPLNGIIGCTELILKSESMVKCRELANVSLNESEHLLHLINNVLDYSKIEAGKVELEQLAFNLDELLQQVVASLKLQSETKGVAMNLDISGHPKPWVLGDAMRLRQILINLINNAVKFTTHGSITVSMARVDDSSNADRQRLRFAVSDTGIGIPKERQAAIFSRFTQVDQSTTRRFGGTGLGTSIAFQLVALMGGCLTMESEPGQGTTFAFTVELIMAPASQQMGSKQAGPGKTTIPAAEAIPGRILVAEDTPVNQMVIRQHLEGQGHVVTLVGNGREAVAAFQTQQFDLVLMDVQMPEMDGLAAARRILAQQNPDRRRTPIVALTANTDTLTMEECKAVGMDAVLTKPIRRNPLIAAVSQWLEWSRQQRPAVEQSQPAAMQGRLDENGTAATTATADPPLDYAAALYEFGEAELVRDVVGQLLQTLPGYMQEIRQALTSHDFEKIKQRSHAIKGGAATVEAKPLSRVASELEELCKQGRFDHVPPTVDRLASVCGDLKGYVDTLSWG